MVYSGCLKTYPNAAANGIIHSMKKPQYTRDDLQTAREVLRVESTALVQQAEILDNTFCVAIEAILHCRGRIVISGMGKSGHIGSKIAATLASTGTPAFFVHPAEAAHGDLGMIMAEDVVIALSYSGESEELLAILPALKRKGVVLIAITGRADSALARHADIHIHTPVFQEACPLGLAPTTSTTVMMAVGDALAVALLKAHQFTADDFALSHPAGSLGKRLLVRVADLMHRDSDLPLVSSQASLREAIVTMSEKGLGLCIIAENQQLIGIFTDGDLRRLFAKEDDILSMNIAQVMHQSPTTIESEKLAHEALRVMQEKRINALIVLDKEQIVGALNMHDLLRAGIV